MGTQVTLLDILRTDSTFEKVRTRDGEVWVGKCIHCGGKLTVELDGSASRRVTIEHIVPQSAGGTNDLLNLALACDRCNHQKGRTHDVRGLRDARAAEVVESLLARRRARWRNPEEA
ncbi:MAG: HNH endonuclease [Myxococcota bacterium]